MKRRFLSLLPAISLLLVFVPAVSAQEDTPPLEIKLRRDFGYGGFSGDIQGTFSILADGPDSLVEVQFYVDETLLGTDTEAPYGIQFETGLFDPGVHTIHAVGITAQGDQLLSNELSREFISGDSAMGSTIKIVVPILGITLLITLVSVLFPLMGKKKGKPGPIGEYGPAGGAVCPKCGLPFSRNFFSPNMVMGKLARCPHCGKISIRPRASAPELKMAEDRLRAGQKEEGTIEVDEQDNLRRALDDSRFDD